MSSHILPARVLGYLIFSGHFYAMIYEKVLKEET